MRRVLVGLGLVVVILLSGAGPALAYHDRRPERIVLASYSCDPDRDDCGDGWGGGSDGNSGYRDDGRNENSRRRNRGAFSPGPFDRSPIEMHDVCISLDCSGREKDPKDKPPPKDQRPQSLTDPRKLPQVVQQIIKAGLDMGRLFADGTIQFVETMLTALA